MNADGLWTRLSADGLVQGPQPERTPLPSPWFVRVMLGIAGWIGALFLLGFVAIVAGSAIHDGLSFMLAGAACCGAALTVFWNVEGRDLVEQFALALSFTGQALIAIGIGEDFSSGGVLPYLAIAVIEAALVLAVTAFLHRLLAACATAVALVLAIDQAGLYSLTAAALCAAVALVWLHPVNWTSRGRLWRPVGYGLVLALLLTETFRMLGAEELFGSARAAGWVSSHGGPLLGRVLTSMVLVWAAVTLVLREGFHLGSRGFLLATCAAVLVGAVSVSAPGLGTALLILLLGFASGNRVLMITGVVSLLGFAGHFYYSLHTTLLVKAGILAITGLCLLAASVFLRRAAGELG